MQLSPLLEAVPPIPSHALAAGLARAVLAAKDRKIQAHRRAMAVIFISALLVTGLFTLPPGRVMHAVVSG